LCFDDRVQSDACIQQDSAPETHVVLHLLAVMLCTLMYDYIHRFNYKYVYVPLCV